MKFISIGVILSGLIVATLTYLGMGMFTSIKDNPPANQIIEISETISLEAK